MRVLPGDNTQTLDFTTFWLSVDNPEHLYQEVERINLRQFSHVGFLSATVSVKCILNG